MPLQESPSSQLPLGPEGFTFTPAGPIQGRNLDSLRYPEEFPRLEEGQILVAVYYKGRGEPIGYGLRTLGAMQQVWDMHAEGMCLSQLKFMVVQEADLQRMPPQSPNPTKGLLSRIGRTVKGAVKELF